MSRVLNYRAQARTGYGIPSVVIILGLGAAAWGALGLIIAGMALSLQLIQQLL